MAVLERVPLLRVATKRRTTVQDILFLVLLTVAAQKSMFLVHEACWRPWSFQVRQSGEEVLATIPNRAWYAIC